jgi:periplasmic protein TonB
MKTKTSLNWNDVIFEFKNKDYGAFFLRKIYKKDITIAMSISLLILLIVIGPPFIMAKLNKSNYGYTNNTTIATISRIIDKDITPPPPPPPPPLPPIKNEAIFTRPIVVDSVETEIEISTIDQMIDSAAIRNVKEDVIETETNTITEVSPDPPTWVPEMPVFPGGEEARKDFINDHFVYPEPSKENNMDGTVFVSFVVNENGEVDKVKIERGIDPYIDKEAIRVVSLFPDWIPGKQNGNAVKVKLIIPIKLTLANK